ncbi:glycoside hydrolase family protein [Luteimonas sp. e5]
MDRRNDTERQVRIECQLPARWWIAATVDCTSNLGAGRLQTSTLRRRINQRDWVAAASELRRWVYGGRRVQPGLVTRRKAEITLMLSC